MSEAAAFQQAFGAMLQGERTVDDPLLRRALAVHRNTAHMAARDALAANFPVLAQIVGEDAFKGCASAFVEGFPPVDPRLCLYGAGFARHVGQWAPFAGLPYLEAVAEIEWLVVEALFAADAVPLDGTLIAAAPDPQMALVLHPATRIRAFDCPVVSLWLAHQEGAIQMLEMIEWAPETALISRRGMAVQMSAVDPAIRAFLAASTLGEAAAAAHEAGGDVATIFATLLATGAFCALS